MSRIDEAVPPDAAAGAQTYILFGVAGTTYALPSRQVQHMEMIEAVTPVPNAPPFVEGVVFSRGQVVPVVNLRARFGFDRTPPDVRTRLIVVQHAGRLVGLLADEAREFVTIGDEAIHPPAEAIGGPSRKYLKGVATPGGRIILLLEVDGLLDAAAP